MGYRFENNPDLKQITLAVLRSLVELLERDEVLVKSISPSSVLGEHDLIESDLTVTVGFVATAAAMRDELAKSTEGPKSDESRPA